MKANVHTILGFYSSGEGDPKLAYDAARSARALSVHLFESENPDKYAQLRIDGESLIKATAATHDVEGVIKALESTGSPAIFILDEDLAQLPAPPDYSRGGSIFARL